VWRCSIIVTFDLGKEVHVRFIFVIFIVPHACYVSPRDVVLATSDLMRERCPEIPPRTANAGRALNHSGLGIGKRRKKKSGLCDCVGCK
jgi:hypothetical protein